jgi:uncharacterized integral membrane protein (TIGR00698 family)
VLASGWHGDFHRCWPGLLMSVVIAIASTFIAEQRGGPTLLYALLLGMALNTVAGEGRAKPGVDFAARRILRLGVALLGARITFAQIGGLGWFNGGLMVAGVVVTIVFGIGAARALGLSRRLGVLTGGATAICGASAAIAIATILPRDEGSERELIFTIAGVTVLSTLAMIVYPVLAKMIGLDAHQTGVFIGGTIHDVAQVVGAGYSISPDVGDYAVLTKLLRVAMLLPVVTAISLAVRHRLQRTEEIRSGDPLLPPFLLAFVAFVIAGSLGLIPKPIGAALNEVARTCLVIAIAAVGLKTSPVEMKKVGARAFALLGVEAVFLAGAVLVAQRAIG